MNENAGKRFKNLKWYRLRIELLNIRSLPFVREHPFSILEAVFKGVSGLERGVDETPAGSSAARHFFFHITNRKHTFAFRKGDVVPVELVFYKCNKDYVVRWLENLKTCLAGPVSGKNFDFLKAEEIEDRTFDVLWKDRERLPVKGELCLEFLTPLPFNFTRSKGRTYLTRGRFINSLERRLEKLFGILIPYNSEKDDFQLLPYYWKYTEIRHSSKSQPGHTQYVNGCFGKLFIKGSFLDLLPYLVLGQELHAGTKISNSQGYYLLHPRSQRFFDETFPVKGKLLNVLDDVLDRYDDALEALSATESFPFDENRLAEDLCRELETGVYAPLPTTAFKIKKKDGSGRLVEQPKFRDLIVEQYILKTITPVFDRMFEKGSIGFRKGMSVENAVQLIEKAVREGYRYVVESDIEDFFPSVDLEKLKALVDFHLPERDVCLKKAIGAVLKKGYILNGQPCSRKKGLAQGSPLSPILANLYLDAFDEMILEKGLRVVRYSDDFVILTRTKEEAEKILSESEAILNGLGLEMKEEKTAIKSIRDGFLFLGVYFDGTEGSVTREKTRPPFKKPLYISSPHLFLSLNGAAVDIKDGKRLVQTVPVRRISEIMIMNRGVISTSLVRKCTDNNIPITMNLDSGYYLTTIKPDSKKYYDLVFDHGRKFEALSEGERLLLAKEFAAGKIKNYIPFLKQRYRQELGWLLKGMEEAVSKVYAAESINAVRGIEGAMSKKTYGVLNHFLEDDFFHFKKRNRKSPDPLNSMLNFGYYLLFSKINAHVRAVGLNPYLGFLHSAQDNYESLVCDIEELFRSGIDRLIIRMINLKIIKAEDFKDAERGRRLTHEGVKRFVNQFELEMNKKKDTRSLSLAENIYVQVGIFKDWVLNDQSLSFYRWEV